MELRRYVEIVFRWWYVVAISLVVVTAGSYFFSINQTPQYRSTLTLIASPKATIADLSTVRQSLDTLNDPLVINTYAEVIKSKSIYAQALNSLELPVGLPPEVKILVTTIPKTSVIQVDAEGPNAKMTYDMVNAVVSEAYSYLPGLFELYEVKVLDPAGLPLEPFRPDIRSNTVLGAALGLLLGLCAAFVISFFQESAPSRAPAAAATEPSRSLKTEPAG